MASLSVVEGMILREWGTQRGFTVKDNRRHVPKCRVFCWKGLRGLNTGTPVNKLKVSTTRE